MFTEKNQIMKHYVPSDLTGVRSKGKAGAEVLMVENSERRDVRTFIFTLFGCIFYFPQCTGKTTGPVCSTSLCHFAMLRES